MGHFPLAHACHPAGLNNTSQTVSHPGTARSCQKCQTAKLPATTDTDSRETGSVFFLRVRRTARCNRPSSLPSTTHDTENRTTGRTHIGPHPQYAQDRPRVPSIPSSVQSQRRVLDSHCSSIIGLSVLRSVSRSSCPASFLPPRVARHRTCPKNGTCMWISRANGTK